MLEPFEAVKRRVGLDRDQDDAVVVFAQAAADANERAAGAQAGNKVRDSPAQLLDQLRSGRVVVRRAS